MGELPEYPFWQAGDVEAAFGAGRHRYATLSKEEATQVSRLLRAQAQAFTMLFFRGGRLADHNLQWKPEIAKDTAPHLTLHALMCSFECSHEVKEATVALALHHWCEPISQVEPA